MKTPKLRVTGLCGGNSPVTVVWASDMELLVKESRLCDEIEAFKRNIKIRLFEKFVNESILAIILENHCKMS